MTNTQARTLARAYGADMIKILDMKMTGHYADGAPLYGFSTGGFPSRGVRKVGQVVSTPELAYVQGQEILSAYLTRDPLGNMGVVLGVTASEGGYQAVINTYHSRT